MDKTYLYGVDKLHPIIGNNDKNLFLFDHCKQHMPDSEFRIKGTVYVVLSQTNPNCSNTP